MLGSTRSAAFLVYILLPISHKPGCGTGRLLLLLPDQQLPPQLYVSPAFGHIKLLEREREVLLTLHIL